MILQTAKLNRKNKVVSKKTNDVFTVKMVRRSQINPSMDVFLVMETSRYIWRDSIRRRYNEI